MGFSFQKNLTNLYLACKMAQDYEDWFRRGKNMFNNTQKNDIFSFGCVPIHLELNDLDCTCTLL